MEHVLQNGQWRFTLVGWDGIQPVGWIHSARMEEWLSRRHPVAPLIDTSSHPARHDAQ
ncbi:MAG: hypothetical protein M1546_14505 [Chloroflexi bacterium]|nr:hypothetical protein [Chloroflexota bacterium]